MQPQWSLKGAALDKKPKPCNPVTELELNIEWAETGLAQALKASTSTPVGGPEAVTSILH